VVVVTTTALVILCRLVIVSVWEMTEDRLRRLANDHHHREDSIHPNVRTHACTIRPISPSQNVDRLILI
jgi:hypothetical protein